MAICAQSPLMPSELVLLNVRCVSNDIVYDIINEVCRHCNVFPADVTAINKGKREICDARHIAVSMLDRYTTLSYDNIGSFFGTRNHCAIGYSLGVSRDFIKTDRKFKELYILCETAIRTKFYL